MLQFTLFVRQISLKTGYDKLLSVSVDGSIHGTAEAIGVREEFTVLFEEGFQVIFSSVVHKC